MQITKSVTVEVCDLCERESPDNQIFPALRMDGACLCGRCVRLFHRLFLTLRAHDKELLAAINEANAKPPMRKKAAPDRWRVKPGLDGAPHEPIHREVEA